MGTKTLPPDRESELKMADTDDDWKAFLEATELDDDDVETPSGEDENLEDEELDEDDPTKKKSTESDKKGGDGGEDDDPEKGKDPKDPKKPDSTKDDDPEKGKDPKKPDPKADDETYKPRLTQFLNDNGELDVKKVEDAYIASSKEGVRLNDELSKVQDQLKQVLSAIAKDPEAAKKILGEEGAARVAKDGSTQPEAKDPILADYEAKMVKKSHQEYDEFIEGHPEAVSDPEKARKIGEFLKFYGPWYQQTNGGEIAGMKDSLEAAYRQFGWDLEVDKTEKVASAAKDKAATRSTPQGKKPSKTGANNLTKQEEFFAKKLGVKL